MVLENVARGGAGEADDRDAGGQGAGGEGDDGVGAHRASGSSRDPLPRSGGGGPPQGGGGGGPELGVCGRPSTMLRMVPLPFARERIAD